ncbi:MAG: DUF3054 domain-containing protein, partial [Actinomycetota bacterium]
MRRVTVAAVVDALLILLFAAMGRRAHDEGAGVASVLSTAAPFLIGYAVAAAALRLHRAPLDLARGALAWAAGIPLG